MRYGERHSVPLRLVATLDDLYWTVYLNGITAYGDAAATFDALHARGVSVGVGTNMSTHWQLRKLERCGLVDKVDFLVTSEIAGAEKPSAAFFGHCLRKAGVAPENCLFVGDNPVADIQGATDAGIRALWLVNSETIASKPAFAQQETPPNATRIASLSEVLDHL